MQYMNFKCTCSNAENNLKEKYDFVLEFFFWYILYLLRKTSSDLGCELNLCKSFKMKYILFSFSRVFFSFYESGLILGVINTGLPKEVYHTCTLRGIKNRLEKNS